jgi:hypothetical protein
VSTTFWLDAGKGIFRNGKKFVSGSRLYQCRRNGFFFPDGLLIEFQNTKVEEPGPKGWDPTNVVRYSANGDVLWEIQPEVGGNGYREIRACPGGYLEATSRDGLRKYWLKATTGQVFSQVHYPDPEQILSDEDRCTWSVTGNQVFYQGELRFEKPKRSIEAGCPIENDLMILWAHALSKYPETGFVYDPQNVIRLRSDGSVVWLIQMESVLEDARSSESSQNVPGCGFTDLRPGTDGLIEVTSSDFYGIYSVDPETGKLTYLRDEESRW